jgi:hypothetical protein
MSANKKRCFVIMPFSETTKEHTEDYWTEHYESFLKPLIEEIPEIEAHRSEALRQNIVGEIIKDLAVSSVVVADLTDNNPNVYWELGVRQSFKHCTVTIAEKGSKLASDLVLKGTLFYPKNHLSQQFRKSLKKAVKDCLENPERPDSDVLVALSGRGSLYEIFRREEIIRRLDAVLYECDFNIRKLTMDLDRAKKRQKSGGRIPIAPLHACAIELLATNRYVDEDNVFFDHAYKCLGTAVKFNERLSQWAMFEERTDTWMVDYVESFRDEFEKLRQMVESARNKVANRF